MLKHFVMLAIVYVDLVQACIAVADNATYMYVVSFARLFHEWLTVPIYIHDACSSIMGIANAFLLAWPKAEQYTDISVYRGIKLIPVFVICFNYLYWKTITSVIVEIEQLIVSNHTHHVAYWRWVWTAAAALHRNRTQAHPCGPTLVSKLMKKGRWQMMGWWSAAYVMRLSKWEAATPATWFHILRFITHWNTQR